MQIGILSNLYALVTCFNPFPIYTKQRVSTLLSGKRATGRRKHKGRNREQTRQVAVIVHENSISSLLNHPIQRGIHTQN